MSNFVFPPPPPASVAIEGRAERFPVHRIYCVGRNYSEHAREMGVDPNKEPPFFFLKPADAIVASESCIPYPTRTTNFHHEIELVVAIGKRGANIDVEHALDHVFGYAVGNDLTRRDLQLEARAKGRPWDVSKAFDQSAAIGTIRPVERGHIDHGRISIKVNGVLRQEADVAELIWSVPEIIAELSTLFMLEAGDLIYTGTPAGVSALNRGDELRGEIDGLQDLRSTIAS